MLSSRIAVGSTSRAEAGMNARTRSLPFFHSTSTKSPNVPSGSTELPAGMSAGAWTALLSGLVYRGTSLVVTSTMGVVVAKGGSVAVAGGVAGAARVAVGPGVEVDVGVAASPHEVVIARMNRPMGRLLSLTGMALLISENGTQVWNREVAIAGARLCRPPVHCAASAGGCVGILRL